MWRNNKNETGRYLSVADGRKKISWAIHIRNEYPKRLKLSDTPWRKAAKGNFKLQEKATREKRESLREHFLRIFSSEEKACAQMVSLENSENGSELGKSKPRFFHYG